MNTHRRSALALFAAALLVAGCAGMTGRDPLNVTVAGVEPMKGEGLELRLGVKLRVQNPTTMRSTLTACTSSSTSRARASRAGVSDAHGTVPR
jgi:hypothetical protein